MIPLRLDSIEIRLEQDSSYFIEFSPWTPNVPEEEMTQIRFNPHELMPHLHRNRVASEIWLIIWR